jgi:Response regulators consisting of a CheY-like receiver domain and a winged-helix DNA-binding domain
MYYYVHRRISASESVKDYFPRSEYLGHHDARNGGWWSCALNWKMTLIPRTSPLSLLTGLNTDKSIIHGLQTGADEYLVKPVYHRSPTPQTLPIYLPNLALMMPQMQELWDWAISPTILLASIVLQKGL